MVTVLERLKEMEEEVLTEEMSLWGSIADMGGASSLEKSAKYRAIQSILHAQPILVAPTLEWLRTKQAELSMAQLRVLYTEDQISEMTKQVET